MITHIIEDTRNKIDKNTHIREYFDKQGIQLIRTKMLVGDFTSPKSSPFSVSKERQRNNTSSIFSVFDNSETSKHILLMLRLLMFLISILLPDIKLI